MDAGLGVVPPIPAAMLIPIMDAGLIQLAPMLTLCVTEATFESPVAVRSTGPPLDRLASVVLLI